MTSHEQTVSGLQGLIDQARWRLRLRGAVRGGAWASWAVAPLALIVIGLKLLGAISGAQGLLSLAVGVAVAVALGLALGAVWARWSDRELALWLDRRLGTEEILVTSLHVTQAQAPGRAKILAELSEALRRELSVREAIPLQTPRHLGGAGAVLALGALIVLWAPARLASFNPLVAPTGDPVVAEGEVLQERLTELAEAGGVPLPEELERGVAELSSEMQEEVLTPEEAVERLERLQAQIQAFQEDLEESQDLLEDLEQAARALNEGLTQDLAEDLERGDMQAAAEAAAELAQSLDGASPAERQAAAEAMQRAGERLSSASSPELQQAGEALKEAGEQLGGEGLSPEQAQELSEQLSAAQEAGDQLQRDQQALERAQQMNGAMESTKQRLGGEPGVSEGASSQGEGEGEQGLAAGGEEEGEGEAAVVGRAQAAPDQSHTWEDEGEHDSPNEHADQDRSSDRAHGEHLDDFDKFYRPVRLEDVDTLLASVEGQVDEGGRVDVLITRLSGSEEQAEVGRVALPASYREEAAEAIEAETIPPAYREAVKQYFDKME